MPWAFFPSFFSSFKQNDELCINAWLSLEWYATWLHLLNSNVEWISFAGFVHCVCFTSMQQSFVNRCSCVAALASIQSASKLVCNKAPPILTLSLLIITDLTTPPGADWGGWSMKCKRWVCTMCVCVCGGWMVAYMLCRRERSSSNVFGKYKIQRDTTVKKGSLKNQWYLHCQQYWLLKPLQALLHFVSDLWKTSTVIV